MIKKPNIFYALIIGICIFWGVKVILGGTLNSVPRLDSGEPDTSGSLALYHWPKKTSLFVDERNFAIEFDRINTFPLDYENCEIEISGKITKNPRMKSNEFGLVRDMIFSGLEDKGCSSSEALESRSINDKEVAGFLCSIEPEKLPKDESWVNVKGNIKLGSPTSTSFYEGNFGGPLQGSFVIQPVFIQVSTIIPIEKPTRDVVYPY